MQEITARGLPSWLKKSRALPTNQGRPQSRCVLFLKKRGDGVSAAVMATEQGARAVEAGVAESSEAERAIGVLSTNVSEGAHAAQVIEASSDQQLVGVDQVAQAMANIEQAMQQNVGGDGPA